MVNPMVDRATSDMLIGPDWAMNIEICDMLNRDPGLAKDVVKGIKKRIGSKNSKVQLLALMLLETIVKNCGDIVHMHVAERDVLHEMVKIVKKRPDYQVKEKILTLIDTWQEAFGGPRARYPQYYAAYQELLRVGAVFPQRSERSASVFTPPQSHPLSPYSQNVRNSEHNQESSKAESSAESEFPTLSLSEIQNAQGSMDVLAEMLNAVDPGNKEGLRQEALLDLVEQCRTYKQRVLHLVNSTMDESLLSQGLALNDDLQHVLAKYESLASGQIVQQEKPKPESAARNLVDVDDPLVNTGDTVENGKQADGRSASGKSALMQSSLPPPSSSSGTKALKTDPKMDLLSGDLLGGDDLNSLAQKSLALVPVSAPQPSSPVASNQNALALVDMFSDAPNPTNSHATPFSTGPEFQQQQLQSQPQQQYPFYQNGINPSTGLPVEQAGFPQQVSSSTWGAQSLQQPSSPIYGAQNDGALPPPPWESQSPETQAMGSPYYPTMQVSMMGGPQSPRMQGAQHPLGLPMQGNNQVMGRMFVQPVTGEQLSAINQAFRVPPSGMYTQHQHMQVGGGPNMMGMLPQAMQASQMASTYPSHAYGNQMQMGGYGYGYGYDSGYGHQQDVQYLDQRMYDLSVKDDTAIRSNASNQNSMASYLPLMKQPGKGDDKLFGDLVNMAKLKPTKSPPSGTGSA